jgi:hypothetical protein
MLGWGTHLVQGHIERPCLKKELRPDCISVKHNELSKSKVNMILPFTIASKPENIQKRN